MQVVATLSLKGGVGKTTVALGLAGAAQQHGVRTLVVDLDPQANATIALDTGPTTATVADVLDEPPPLGAATRDHPERLGRRGWTCWWATSRPSGTTTPIPGGKQLSRLSRALGGCATSTTPDGPSDPRTAATTRTTRARALPAGDRGLPALARASSPAARWPRRTGRCW